MENKTLNIFIDGMPSIDINTTLNKLKIKHSSISFSTNGILSKYLNLHWDSWQNVDESQKWDYYIILEHSDIKNDPELFKIRYRYRTLAAFYENVHLIDITSLSAEDLIKELESIFINNSNYYSVPNMDNMTEEVFLKLPFIIEGESKIVRAFNHRFHIVKYKPTVYSHKMQRAGVVEGTDRERMIMTKNLIDIFSRHMIAHSYWYIGKNYILNEVLDNNTDIPPIEVIVKRCFVGSDKHRYYNLQNLTNRFNQNVVKPERSEYQKLLVRFDYRNPNFHPDSGVPLGDILMCDDLADEFINVNMAKPNAIKIFKCLDEHFTKMNIYFEDVCLMLTVNGDKLYGEVSQDCGRYKYVKENELSDLDKDVWRAGGSSQLVLQKYQMLSNIVSDYVKIQLYS
jgi:phosphoribosylaminoimidazole-succinocarboxamide synthase